MRRDAKWRNAKIGRLAALTIGAAGAASMIAGAALITAGVASAQDIPPGQSCGGLFCDLGIFGHKVPLGPNGEAPTPEQIAVAVDRADTSDPHRLPCHDFLCRAFGQKDAEAAPPPPPPVAEVAPAPEPHKAAHKRRAKVAAARTPAPAEPAAAPPPAR